MLSIVYYLSFALILPCLVIADSPSLTNGSISFHQVNVLGHDFHLAQMEMIFDQALAIPEAIITPFLENECPPLPTCTPCDFTVKNPSVCSLNCCGTSPEHLDEWCSPSRDFISLPIGVESPLYTVGSSNFMAFRFFLGPETWCSPIKIKVRLHSGHADLSLSSRNPWPNSPLGTAEIFSETSYALNGQSLVMAPWWDGTTGLGTIAFQVFGKSRSSFTVEIIIPPAKIPFQPAPDPGSCSNIPTEITSQGPIICIEDTKTFFSLAQDLADPKTHFVFSVPPGCHTYSFIVSPIRDETGYQGDVDLYCTPIVSSIPTSGSNSLFASFGGGADYLTFSTCSEERTWMRCTGNVWQSGNIAATFSTVMPLMLKPIEDLNAYDYTTFVARNAMVPTSVEKINLGSNFCADWTYVFFLY